MPRSNAHPGPSRVLSGWLCACLLVLTCACGAGGSASLQSGSDDLAVRSGSFSVVAVDALGATDRAATERLNLQVEPIRDGQRVRIKASGLRPTDRAWLHLRYDGANLHPVLSQAGGGLADRTLFMGESRQPGLVMIGLQGLYGEPVLSGNIELALLEFSRGPASSRRAISTVTSSLVADLRFDSTNTSDLEFSYTVTGDYDQNSEVNVADLTPIGIHFQKTSASADWAAARVADGDKNNEVNISDLTPIGVNFLSRCTAYQVQSGPAASGPWGDVTGGSIAQSAGVKPPGGGFLEYTHTLAAPVDGAWYCVVALEGTERAAGTSNAVQYGAEVQLLPPTNLTAVSDGTNIQLNWQAPVGAVPDSYRVSVASDAAMTSPQELQAAVVGTNFEVPGIFSPDQEWFFGVQSNYGAQVSAYAIAHYGGSGGNDPPQQLTAVKNVDHIELAWANPASGTPDGYNAYIASDNAMSDAFKLNSSGLIVGNNYALPTLFDPEVEHYFGVKADYGGTESEYSNIFFYEPGGTGTDTTPPVWNGGIGIKTVEPDDTLVHVSWWPAVDADTPPVQYLLYVVAEPGPIDWNDPYDVFPGTTLDTNVIGLTNDTKYHFAVRAQDGVTPTPNVTTNTNELTATPGVFPPDGAIGAITSSDVASVRMPGEEIPRIVAVNHSTELWYVTWNGSAWTSLDLNTAIGNPDRKYHPQMVAVGNEVHIVFGTQNGVWEYYGDMDTDPLTWDLLPVTTSGVSSVFGIGFAYSPALDYLAVVYATNNGGEKLYYSDRDSDGIWFPPISVMDGNPQIWACDLALNDNDGSQWFVAASGQADSTGDELKFWYGTRADRTGSWTVLNTGYGGDVMAIKIDPTIHQPVVLDAEVRNVDTGFGNQPVSDATIFTWNGSSWIKNVLETGSCTIDLGNFTIDTVLTGQDPQIVFSPSGKAVGLWSKLDFFVNILDETGDLSGDWRFSARTDTSWSTPDSMLLHICSGNSVTAGESYQHCITCDLGVIDSGDYQMLIDKYSARNDYVEGDLWYHRQSWN